MSETILRQTLIMLILMAVGVLCAKIGMIRPETNKDLSKIVLQVVNPATIFMSYQTDYRPELAKELIHSFALSAAVFAALIAGAYILVRKKPGRDLRDELPPPLLRSGDIMEVKDLKPGMELVGTVRNIIDFGVFVDIGVHEDGLVHISQICNRYIKHPLEAVKVGEVVKVRVLDVDVKRNRISLTMRLNDEEEKNQRAPRKREKKENKGFDPSRLKNAGFRIKQK